MVEPFGCVVMLHWRLPRLRSSRFQLPFPSGLCSTPDPRNRTPTVARTHTLARRHIRRPCIPRHRFTSDRTRAPFQPFREKGWHRMLSYGDISLSKPTSLGNCVILNERAYFFAVARDCIVRRYRPSRLLNGTRCLAQSRHRSQGQFTRLLRDGMATGVLFSSLCSCPRIRSTASFFPLLPFGFLVAFIPFPRLPTVGTTAAEPFAPVNVRAV